MDRISGVVFALIGFLLAAYSSMAMPLGTFRQLGPGMFPTMIGVALAVVGLLIVAFSREDLGQIILHRRSLISIVLAIVIFSLIAPRFGILPAIVSMILISSFAEEQYRWKTIIIMCTILPLIAYIIFVLLIRLPITMFRW